MTYKKLILAFFCLILIEDSTAQNDSVIFAKYTTKTARTKLYQNLVKNSINKNLSLSLNESTEDNWQQAFSAMETIGYKSPWIFNRIQSAFDSLQFRSIDFQSAFVEFIFTNYPAEFSTQISHLSETGDPKLFALCMEYLMRISPPESLRKTTSKIINNRFKEQLNNPVIKSLQNRLQPSGQKNSYKILPELFKSNFLEGNIIVYSIQRKNRDYPGIVIIRKSNGSFVQDSMGSIFNVHQLARSITNLPFYLRNGNTPQGIYRMFGFEVSKNNFIGPTTNVQLTMPFETNIGHFMKDSTVIDSVWTINWYKKLLQDKLKEYTPLFESYYAGEAGRTEIIAHGSAINPDYYINSNYYPLTPSLGCLCTREQWDEETGKRLQSDQQKLVNALQSAGGADGYCIVIELDDKELPVNINEVLPFIPQ